MPFPVAKTSIPFWSKVGLLAGKSSTRGIKIPSVLLGVTTLLAVMSKIAFGLVLFIPTCALTQRDTQRIKIVSIFFIITMFLSVLDTG